MEFLAKNIGVHVEIGDNLAFKAEELLENIRFAPKKTLFISDAKIIDNCKKFYKKPLEKICTGNLILQDAKPDEETVAEIEKALENYDFIVALGSGTINDLCKFASFKAKKSYAIFASAPSMNGYLSKNASLLVRGHKKTVAAELPKAVFCDLGILKNAPVSMKKAGIGDAMCFYGCWFDWLLSHLLLETDFNAECFAILSDEMQDFVQNYEEFTLDDDEFLEKLIKILLLSGASMTMAEGSFPASQSEHLIAHSYAMKYPQKDSGLLHGLQIATTCLTTAKIQEELLAQEFIEIRDTVFDMEKISAFFGAKIAKECEAEYLQKQELIKQNRKFLQQELSQNWMDYCKVLSRVFFSEQNLRDIFKHFAIDVGHNALGLERDEYNDVVGHARFIRNRFTCLDL